MLMYQYSVFSFILDQTYDRDTDQSYNRDISQSYNRDISHKSSNLTTWCEPLFLH